MFGGAEELRGGAAPAEWQGEVEPRWLSYEANPFTGKPFFNEVCAPVNAAVEDFNVVLCQVLVACLALTMPSQHQDCSWMFAHFLGNLTKCRQQDHCQWRPAGALDRIACMVCRWCCISSRSACL